MKNESFGPHEEFILNPELKGADLRSPLDLRLARIKVIGVMLGWKPDDYANEEDLAAIGWMLEQLVLEVREMACVSKKEVQ